MRKPALEACCGSGCSKGGGSEIRRQFRGASAHRPGPPFEPCFRAGSRGESEAHCPSLGEHVFTPLLSAWLARASAREILSGRESPGRGLREGGVPYCRRKNRGGGAGAHCPRERSAVGQRFCRLDEFRRMSLDVWLVGHRAASRSEPVRRVHPAVVHAARLLRDDAAPTTVHELAAAGEHESAVARRSSPSGSCSRQRAHEPRARKGRPDAAANAAPDAGQGTRCGGVLGVFE